MSYLPQVFGHLNSLPYLFWNLNKSFWPCIKVSIRTKSYSRWTGIATVKEHGLPSHREEEQTPHDRQHTSHRRKKSKTGSPFFSKQGDHNARHDEINTTVKQRLGQERKKKKKKKKKKKNAARAVTRSHKTLRKHVYSNILKISPQKKKKMFSDKHWYFTYFCSKHRLWVLVRTASPRRF